MTPDDRLRDSRNASDTAGDMRVGPDPDLTEAPPGEPSGGRGAGHEGGWPTLPAWSAFSDRVRREVGVSGTQDALIWSVLIAVLGLYGWYAAGLRSDAEQVPLAAESPVDMALQRVAAEKASLERQIAEASARIAALEETLKAQRRQSDPSGQVPSDAPAAGTTPSGRSSLVAALGGRATEHGILLDLADSDLSFPVGQATLPAGERPGLDRIASVLVQHPTLTIRVEGHTDSAGPEHANLTLSQARADAVRQALVERGVPAERIETVGLGETRPIADNGTPAGRDRNRRIEVYLIEGLR